MADVMGLVDADAHFESRSAHCKTLLCNAKAAFFLPGDIPTLHVLFALVCEIQTGRRERMPVSLVGHKYWQHDKLKKKGYLVEFCSYFYFTLSKEVRAFQTYRKNFTEKKTCLPRGVEGDPRSSLMTFFRVCMLLGQAS